MASPSGMRGFYIKTEKSKERSELLLLTFLQEYPILLTFIFFTVFYAINPKLSLEQHTSCFIKIRVLKALA